MFAGSSLAKSHAATYPAANKKFTALDHAQVVREAQEAALALRAKANWPPA